MDLGLKSVVNARDIGGYIGTDGKSIKSGVLLRTGSLDNISDDDIGILRKYNITDVIDFRLPEEKSGNGCLDWVTEHNINLIDKSKVNSSPVLKEGYTVEDFKEYISVAEQLGIIGKNRYINFIESKIGKQGYAEFLNILINAKGSVLYHCASGKDRTGVATVLIMGLLGVSSADIIFNFLLSNEYNRERINTVYKYFWNKTHDKELTDTAVVFFEGVSGESIVALLKHIKSNYGTIVNYCKQCLNMSNDDIGVLRNKYLW